MRWIKFLLLLALMPAIRRHANAGNKKPFLKTGSWRAVLQRSDGKQIVFNFISKVEKGRQVIYVVNGKEQLLIDSIQRKADSIYIHMPFFASGFRAIVKPDGNLEGLYIKSYGDKTQEIQFYAEYGNNERYAGAAVTKYNITGSWVTRFGKDTTLAIGEFQQAAQGKVTGTFRTPTGDYRYLEGIVSGDSLILSGFDGGHAILFTAKLDNDSSISQADMYSGLSAHQSWTARKSTTVQLPDGYSQTKLRAGENRLNFRFRSTNGDTIAIDDDRFKNKVVIVQILGSWCPNCMDETAFLSEFYKQNRDKGLEIIGLAYERTPVYETGKTALASFQKRFDVQYPFLLTGVAVSDAQRTEKTLPQIDGIKAFPTTIFIDKKGNVRKIHTGFDGPATGKHYDAFKQEFNELVTSLLKENP
jgi:thiol-disulfide isomerase/thioredoxin